MPPFRDQTALPFLRLAEKILSGDSPTDADYRQLISLPDEDVFSLLPGADRLRSAFYQKGVHLCAICNGKSGGCTEDCAFCAQSRSSRAVISAYPLMSKAELTLGGEAAASTPIHRYSIVTSGKRLSRKEILRVAEAVADLIPLPIQCCASLGILEKDDLEVLKEAGLSRYHHNLETARGHFSHVCSTHSYDARIATLKAAKAVGLSVCSGGIFGIGETDEQVLELALTLKAIDVDAVPLNFLIPVRGTPLARHGGISPLRCLKVIAIFRYVLPEKDIYVCGGREFNLQSLHPLIFHAGASGIMTGNYLTTRGRSLNDDLDMLRQLSFHPREKAALKKRAKEACA